MFIRPTLAPEHGLQLNARLRKRIVRDQASISQRVQQITLVDLCNQLQHLVALTQQAVNLFTGSIILRTLLSSFSKHINLFLALFVGLAFLHKLLKVLLQTHPQTIDLTLALHKVLQALTHNHVHVLAQQIHEGRKQPWLIFEHMVAEVVRKARLVSLLHGIKGC